MCSVCEKFISLDYYLICRFFPYFTLLALCIPAGGVCVPAAVSGSQSVPPPVSGLHYIQVVHAARGLDEESGVCSAVAITMAAYSPVVGERA